MSVFKEALDKIKSVLKFEEQQEPTAPLSGKLKDGTEVTYTVLAVGGTLMIAGAPAPASTYELEDGTMVTVDETGTITAVNGVTAPVEEAKVNPPATVPPPIQQAHHKYDITEELKKPEGIRALMEKFATGTPEERLANLELLTKVVFEYTFGWQIREQQEKAEREAAIKVYTDKLQKQQVEIEAQREALRAVTPVLEELAKAPTSDPPPSKKSFAITPDLKKKTLSKFQEAMAQLDEQKAKRKAV